MREKLLEALSLTNLARVGGDGWSVVLWHRCFKSQIRLPPAAAPHSPVQLSWLLQPSPFSIHLSFAPCFRVLWTMDFISYWSANYPKEGFILSFFPSSIFFNFYFLRIRTWEKKMFYWNTAMFCCAFKGFSMSDVQKCAQHGFKFSGTIKAVSLNLGINVEGCKSLLKEIGGKLETLVWFHF